MTNIFITGIGTEIGKTITSAIVVESLQADYFKPIQAGDLDNSDTHKVQKLVSNSQSKFHKSAFNLNTPMSPHASADIDKVTIKASKVIRPKTQNNLIIEGAGGILVPINQTETITDLIQKEDKIIVVSRHYLGSINHTLLTIESLKNKGFDVAGIIFNGEATPTTENIITQMSGVSILGRIDEEPYFDQNVVKYYAEKFKKELKKLA